MIRFSLFVILLLLHTGICAQLTLKECQEAAHDNYPQARQYQLIQLAEEYSLQNVRKRNLPQISLSGKVSWQSEATTFPFEIPGTGMKGLPKNQYQVLAEVRQTLWDGGQTHYQKQQVRAETEEKERQLDVSMYALNDRVNQVFFGILLLEEQLRQNDLLRKDLERNLRDIGTYQQNGLANETDADAVQAEILQVGQQRQQLQSNRRAYLRMLSLLTGKKLGEDTVLEQPIADDGWDAAIIRRPELDWYRAQEQQIEVQKKRLKSNYMPQFGLFAQAAYGNPGLDLFKDKFRTYGMAGIQFTWNFGSLYTLKDDKRNLETRRKMVDTERELFLFHTRLQLIGQQERIRTLRMQLQEDDEIIRLRTRIRKAAEIKVANGTLSVTEMLRELTAESLARQTKAQHEMELLMEQFNMKQLTN